MVSYPLPTRECLHAVKRNKQHKGASLDTACANAIREFGPGPTLGELQRSTPWVWLWCERCPHHALRHQGTNCARARAARTAVAKAQPFNCQAGPAITSASIHFRHERPAA